MVNDGSALIEQVETQRLCHTRITGDSHKSLYGQYLTPSSVAAYMASMFPKPLEDSIHLLDPGAGIGGLSCAFVLGMNQRTPGLHYRIDCYDIDGSILTRLGENLHSLSSTTSIEYSIFHGDFIESAVERILDFEIPCYTHVIMNPPYKKVHSNSMHRKLLKSIDLEIVNLYSAFVSLSLELLMNDGFLVAIIPRSFCNGTYYLPFRKHILHNAVIRRIHLFDSRSSLFKEDRVLQENIIIMLQKNNEISDVELSYSKDQSMVDVSYCSVSYDSIVDLNSWELIINIPKGNKHSVYKLESSFLHLGIMVSTGPIVDFRNRRYIDTDGYGCSIPLVYPKNIHSFRVVWPTENGLRTRIDINSETKRQIYENGYYVVVKRFSSKEENRRIVAALYEPQNVKSDFVAFENHLNVFHQGGKGLEPEIAFGLVALLNSEGFDEEFRVFSGHTQVNVSDLKRMRYPSKEQLKEIGSRLNNVEFSYYLFEKTLQEVLKHETD